MTLGYKYKNIDLMKIGKIRTKKQLKEFHINKELMNGNYLFHYLILTNNLVGLKLASHPIYKFNNDDMNGFMLAAKEKKYEILKYLINKYKSNYIYAKNKKNMNFLHFLNPEDMMYIDIIKYFYKSVDWKKLFGSYSNAHMNGIDILFLKGSYNVITTIINNIKLNYGAYISQPYAFELLMNNNLTNTNIINILNQLEKEDINIFKYTDNNGYNISFPIVLKISSTDTNDIKLLKYIVDKCGKKLDKYSPFTTNHIFIMAYKIGINTDNYTMAEYIYDNIMENHNYDETNMNGDNIVHFILKSRLNTQRGDYTLEKKILEKSTNWNIINSEKKTPFDYIVLLDYKYHIFVKNKPYNYKVQITKNKDHNNSKNILSKKWIKYIKTLPIDKADTNISIIETPYAHSNMFQAHFSDIAIFNIYLAEKYKSLYYPNYKGNDVKPNWSDNILLPDEILEKYNNFPWIIIWNNENNYWIHPHLNKCINKAKSSSKYKGAFVILSMRLPDDGLHATLIFYDFTRNTIERFDPYGNMTALDNMMDETLEEELTNGVNMKYCSPECYFPVSGFQTLSDENNIMNQKMGDFGGYCLAWCLWYVEHKMINLDVEPKQLIRKTINRFMSMDVRPMEYIRNYANYISIFRLNYLKKIGIPDNITSNENLNHTYMEIIYKSIILYNDNI